MQGDNNKTVDTNKDGSILYVNQNNYVGKYLKTVSVFSINSTLSRTIIFILAILTTFFIMVTEIFSIIRNVKDDKKENNVKFDDKEKELLRKEILEELKKEMNNKDKK
jgi:large-conductance mechanosensitive channel